MERFSRGCHDQNRAVEPRFGVDSCIGCWPSLWIILDSGVMAKEITIPIEYPALTTFSADDIG
jgi:hypothetical protein